MIFFIYLKLSYKIIIFKIFLQIEKYKKYLDTIPQSSATTVKICDCACERFNGRIAERTPRSSIRNGLSESVFVSS